MRAAAGLPATLLALGALACSPASAQSLQPGQWQFDSVMTMVGAGKPQTSSVQRCVTREEAADAERWTGRKLEHTDCKMTVLRKTSTRMRWALDCPKSGTHGTGSATVGRGTMASEQHMSGELQGRTYEMEIRTRGKRLGPCKS